MKKLFTFLTCAVIFFSGYAAEKPTNDAFYIVGNMNLWVTPDDESTLSDWEYKLTDEDGDGVYTGSFELTERPEFKLFSGVGQWSDKEVYFGYDSGIVLLDTPKTIRLLPGYGSNNISIANWVPGVLSISAEWVQQDDETWWPVLTLSGSNQPSEIPKPTNNEFYLVGDMTDWKLPTSANAADWKYKLIDENGDGVYTGSIELTKDQREFVLFSKPDELLRSEYKFGYNFAYDGAVYLFGDTDTSVRLTSNGNNINLMNWEGGKLEMSVEWSNEFSELWYPNLTFSAPEQPDKPKVPEIYLIGDFNNWELPTAESLNGSVQFGSNMEYDSGYSMQSSVEWNRENKIQFAACKFDKTTGEYLFFNPNENIPFTLYSFAGVNGNPLIPSCGIRGSWVETASPKDYSLNLNDWQGGKILLYFSLPYIGDDLLYLDGTETKVLPDPEPLYIITECNGIKEKFPAQWFTAENYYSFNVWARGETVSIIISTEDSLTPDPNNCYGIEESLAEAGMGIYNKNKMFSLVKGGKPFSMDFAPYSAKLTVYFYYLSSRASVQLEYYNGPIDADQIYVCGQVLSAPDGENNNFMEPSDTNRGEYNNYWRLKEIESGVFSGTYYIPAKETTPVTTDQVPQFRFFTDLLGWSSATSLGSALNDFYCVAVDLSSGPQTFNIFHHGLGNWGVTLPDTDSPLNWESNWVKMTVNCNTGKLTLEVANSEVEEIINDTEKTECWYNLQGIKVDKPSQGLYIHIVNGRSRVEYLK